MTYTESMLSPYRENIGEEVEEILREDHEMVCREISHRGLMFLIAYLLVMGISLIKVIFHIITQAGKPERPLPQIRREQVDQVTDLTYLYQMKEARDCNIPQQRVKNQEVKTNALVSLRNYLYQNNLTLKGYILKEVNHRVSDHDLINSILDGGEMAKLSTTYITFGKELDDLLVEVLPSNPKKRTIKGQSCLAFENDYGFMIEELRRIYQEPVKVTFDSM